MIISGKHNEDTRVKIPAILHLTRLGYEYVSVSDAMKRGVVAGDTNIFIDIFATSLTRINKGVEDLDPNAIIAELKNLLDYEDLGKAFYERITNESGIKIIDFENFDNNSFCVCTELTCKNGDEEFRPDITILINGLPLAFIEVKKPNNKGGIVAESDRMNNRRMPNKKYRRFLNATQIMVFSNNMEYDTDGGITPIQGAFYASVSSDKVALNSFREEDNKIFNRVKPIDSQIEDNILRDINYLQIKPQEEYQLNKEVTKPTNRIITSLFSRERIKTLLKYGIAYVKADGGGYEKHIMRYPQFFATLEIEKFLKEGKKRGIIWHTQGSGKTALAYFNVQYLTNYYREKKIVPKFYFVVDRLDLLTQAQDEFTNRGLQVNIANSRDEFKAALKAQGAKAKSDGKNEITVVNIQKFSDESRVVEKGDYDLSVQRIYFLDEVHRSYNPSGSFLANLIASDRNAIFIGLTGTPLLNRKYKDASGENKEFGSRDIFGDYIHKYYYNLSIEDGYTLKLIREGIRTEYKAQLSAVLERLGVKKGAAVSAEVLSHDSFVKPLTAYIIDDFKSSRLSLNDSTIGAMVVCSSSKQARAIFREIEDVYTDIKSALILCDEDDKVTRRNHRDEFKRGNIDILVVFNMLLTGFDAKRLKKLYLNRVVKDHNLLQTLTRVNRPYTSKTHNHKYGYVVDFADIRNEFDKTNAEYLKELQNELGDEWDKYSTLFKSKEEIEAEIKEIKEKLFYYDIENAERFSEQVSAINDRETILGLKRVLENARILGNLIKLYDHDGLWDKLDFDKLKTLFIEVQNRLNLINQKEALENDDEHTNILNIALEEVVFSFRKISESELALGIIDKYKEQLRKTREAMLANFDTQDPIYISLKEELERLFKKKKFGEEKTPAELENDIMILTDIYDEITAQNRRDNELKRKYNGDEKYTRIHKRLLTPPPYPPEWGKRQVNINTALLSIKAATDEKLSKSAKLIENEAYFEQDIGNLIDDSFAKAGLKLDLTCLDAIGKLVVKEYIEEYKGMVA